MAIKIGRPLWNQILHADEQDGFGICTACEKIESGWFQLYQEDAPEIACPNCTVGILEPTGDLIITGELVCEDDSPPPPETLNIVEILKTLYCELQYDELYDGYKDQITAALDDADLDDADLEIHSTALRMFDAMIHSYDKHLN